MDDIKPLNDLWTNMENVDDWLDLPSVYRCWNDVKEDLDDFKHIYKNVERSIQKVIWNCGSREFETDTDGDDEENVITPI